jgi:hypothetical protein
MGGMCGSRVMPGTSDVATTMKAGNRSARFWLMETCTEATAVIAGASYH